MKRTLIVAIFILVAAIIGIGVVTFRQLHTITPQTQIYTPVSLPSTVPPHSDTQISGDSVRAAFQAQTHPQDAVVLYQNVIVSDYAIQLWGNSFSAGQGLLRYDLASGRWVVVSWGGGAWSVGSLVDEGVPKEVAKALLAGVSH